MGEAIASPAARAHRLQTAIVLVLLALAVLVIEWYIYNRRVFI